MATFWTVPTLYTGETCAILATGPSLTREQAIYARKHWRIIAINDAWRLCPDADILHACDSKWWHHHKEALSFEGIKVTLDQNTRFSKVHCLRHDGVEGFNPNPEYLRTGKNSGFQAVHLAMHFGFQRIVLLGFDMCEKKGKSHYFGDHPAPLQRKSPYDLFIRYFESLVAPLNTRGIEVINATPDSALPWFQMKNLSEIAWQSRPA